MRRRLLAALLALATFGVGCAPGDPAPDPTPTAESQPPKDLPSADEAVKALVAA